MENPADSAIIHSILAREALTAGSSGAPQAPQAMVDDATSLWQEVADTIADCPVSLRVTDPGYSRDLVFHPVYGLRLVERNGVEAVPWDSAPPAVLVRHVSLLNRLLAQAAEQRARHGAVLLAASSAATVLMTTEEATARDEAPIQETPTQDTSVRDAPTLLVLDVPILPPLLPSQKRIPPVMQTAGPGAVLSAAAAAGEAAVVAARKKKVTPLRRTGGKKSTG